MDFECTAKLTNKYGLHARPATLFVETCNRFPCDVVVLKEGQEVNGKSIMGIMMLAAECGSQIILQVEGDDAQEAIEELEDFLNKET